MKKNILLLVILFFISTLVSCSQKEKVKSENLEHSFYVANWNVENLFDVIDDPDKNDEDFLPSGSKEWTERKLINKMTNLARVIEFMNDGNGPDILGVEEVENEALLIDLTENYLENKNYKIAYSESPDARGIDNGLIYNSEVFGIESVNPL
ncbi:MAG: endonuclease/exonuclease/phosphatase family protein, partial [Ignavibacteriae bacterium]|nr:endonuclease/exonuclease/phosphatase family protein [Ignavibacteriota bacterium]